MKRVLSVFLCLIMGVGCTVFASAATPEEVREEPPPQRMSYIANTKTLISINNGKATCVGSLTGYQGITTKVEITLILQRKSSTTSSTWTDYYVHPKQTFNSYKGTASCNKNVVKGYQYRTKAVYKAYAGTNFEPLTQYSSAVSY